MMDGKKFLAITEELSNRIDALETLGYEFWTPLGISIIAAGAGFIALVQNKKRAKEGTLQAVKSNIDSAKAQLETLSMELAPLKAKSSLSDEENRELEIKDQILNSVIERLLNAYNDGCDKFFKKQVVKQDFSDMYQNDIRSYIKEFPESFQAPLTEFDSMLKYFKEYLKNIKT